MKAKILLKLPLPHEALCQWSFLSVPTAMGSETYLWPFEARTSFFNPKVLEPPRMLFEIASWLAAGGAGLPGLGASEAEGNLC